MTSSVRDATKRPEHCKVKDEPKLECRQDVCSCRAQSAKSPATLRAALRKAEGK